MNSKKISLSANKETIGIIAPILKVSKTAEITDSIKTIKPLILKLKSKKLHNFKICFIVEFFFLSLIIKFYS